MEIRIALQPKQKLFAESLEQYPVTFFGGARGGGKSAGLRKIFLARRFKYPGSTGAIFRKTFPDLEANHIVPMFQEYPELRKYYNEAKKTINLPNGSKLQFCYADAIKDIDNNYQGREFHDLGIEEAGQWTEVMFRRLMASNRSSKPGIPARAALTGNPGGVGHKWLKRLFIEKRYNEREEASDYNFIQSFVKDNQALLANDPEYVRRLQAEPNEALRKAFLEGDWDIFAGQFFSEIRREVHLIKPLIIPRHWNRFGAYDFGFNHPAAFGWFAVDEDGNVYLYRELIRAQLRVDQFCNLLNQHEDTKLLQPIVAGWDCWVQKGVVNSGGAPTVAEEFLKHGIIIKKAVIDRIQGASQLRNYLAWNGKPGSKPKFFIFDTCPISFDCLTRVEHDPDRVEDVLKIDAVDGDPMTGDDAYDMIRMGLMSRPMITEEPHKYFKHGSQEWLDSQEKIHLDKLQHQIDRQQAQDHEADMYAIMDMDPFEENNHLKHYISKKKGR